MRAGQAFGFALALSCAPGAAAAQATADELLACAAEYEARATYAGVLGQGDAGHLAFLSGRADLFLHLAEMRSPTFWAGCSSDRAPLLSLVLCVGPKDLSGERHALAEERLIELADTYRGNLRLEACMVDEGCADCMRLFNRMVRANFPQSYNTTPP
ncbi:hypothetical protein [Tabrizicola aquatica]|uniref:hypothetical protein n=1 Tax=Tabrizicola aquatica TaxID=909926 RepID=UPI000CD08A6E|nr:hypothetical protein [Tabrizicola aquatica]